MEIDMDIEPTILGHALHSHLQYSWSEFVNVMLYPVAIKADLSPEQQYRTIGTCPLGRQTSRRQFGFAE
ncbi:hypothetical protein CBM2637_A110034 [Cupriavidus taiwanensis]|nr:hypothetical protein CBM2637_A110034 [Cupriavidus taiwanensis]